MVRPPKLDRILAAEATLQPVLAKAHELRALAGLLDGFLPPDLARQARVVNYRDGEVVLVAATSAAAAKLRLLAPSLVIFFFLHHALSDKQWNERATAFVSDLVVTWLEGAQA